MAVEYDCDKCPESFREDTLDGVIKRAAAHNHDHHGGPEEITPEIEAAVRGAVREA